MTTEAARLRETLGRPDLARLMQRLRSRLERGRPLAGTIALPDATSAERDAVNRLLGRPPARGSAVAISLEQLDNKLRRAGLCSSLTEAVELLTGPVINRSAERDALEARWTELFASAFESIATRPELTNWLESIRAAGLLRRYGIAQAERIMSQALAVLARLPAQGIPLAELAAASTGDAHALDPDRPLATIVIRATAALGGIERWDDAELRRDAWAAAGVLCDELSAPVLVLNLRADDESAASRALRLHADAGEPYFLSVRQLLRTPPLFTTGRTGATAFVCENPTVVAATASRVGSKSAPLVCIGGQPCTASRILLRQLRAAGIRLLYHGDFDWPGIQIANSIIARHGAGPWKMSVADYRRSVTGALELLGVPVPASWDEQLMPAMCEAGRAVHEEQVLNDLLADLEGDAFK